MHGTNCYIETRDRGKEGKKMLTYHEEDKVWRRVCSLFIAPVSGLAYVVCLPSVIIGAAVGVMSSKAFGTVLAFLRNLSSFGWRPSEAYLSGKRKRGRM